MTDNYDNSDAAQGMESDGDGRPLVCRSMAVIEALLFISGDSLSIADLKRLTDLSDHEIATCVEELLTQYRQRNGGMIIVELAGGYQ
ncbi:transcriptional regulator, partial [Candidatus Magnetobacterium bavaricum]